ncbi:MAG: TSUP family transporter [Verrucomicrobiota bacterium]
MPPDPWILSALFAAGGIAGFVDAIAGGGGLITVPALLAAGLPPRLALGTNKLQSSCGTLLATWQYQQAGLIAWRPLAAGVAITFVAALAGAWTVTRIDPGFLRRLIPFLLLAIAACVALRPDLGRDPRPARLSRPAFHLLFGLALGFYDGFFGPGTGSFWMMAGVLVLGLDFRQATGHTKAMNLASNLASLLWFVLAGQVDLAAGAIMAAGQLLGARLGAGLVITRGVRLIRPIFLTMVLALTAKLFWDAFG